MRCGGGEPFRAVPTNFTFSYKHKDGLALATLAGTARGPRSERSRNAFSPSPFRTFRSRQRHYGSVIDVTLSRVTLQKIRRGGHEERDEKGTFERRCGRPQGRGATKTGIATRVACLGRVPTVGRGRPYRPRASPGRAALVHVSGTRSGSRQNVPRPGQARFSGALDFSTILALA
jgi:hypothetical protein